MEKKTQTEYLIDAWKTMKYWNASCEDEAIDWCNRQYDYELSPREFNEFIKWRDGVLAIKAAVQEHFSPMQYEKLGELLLNI